MMSLLSKLELGMSGLQQLRALIDAGKQPPLHHTLGIALISADEGFVVVEARPGEGHLNPAGIVHGGYAATVLDTACGCAIHSLLPPYAGLTTPELKIAYRRAMTTQTGAVRADGRAISNGRRAAFSEAKLFDVIGRLFRLTCRGFGIAAARRIRRALPRHVTGHDGAQMAFIDQLRWA